MKHRKAPESWIGMSSTTAITRCKLQPQGHSGTKQWGRQGTGRPWGWLSLPPGGAGEVRHMCPGCGDCLGDQRGGPWCLDTNTKGGASTRWARKTALLCECSLLSTVWECVPKNTCKHDGVSREELCLSFSIFESNLLRKTFPQKEV